MCRMLPFCGKIQKTDPRRKHQREVAKAASGEGSLRWVRDVVGRSLASHTLLDLFVSCACRTCSDKKNINFKEDCFWEKHLWSENPRLGSSIPQLQTWQQTQNRRKENQLLSHPSPCLILITTQWARQVWSGPFCRRGKQVHTVLATCPKSNSETLSELGLKLSPF